MKEYRFWGWQNADVSPLSPAFSSIASPRELYDLLLQLWCADTCAQRMRDKWSPDNPTYGQCSITAFLVQDIFGGKVYGVPLGFGNYHCWNAVGGCAFDLTSEQFGDKVLTYTGSPEQTREAHFAKAEKKARYEALKASLFRLLADREPIPAGRWKHYKGNEYEVLFSAKHSETLEPMVVYRALYGDGSVWVRPASMWNEIVERDGTFFRRFTFLGGKSEQ